MTSIYIWIRSNRSLQFFLPITGPTPSTSGYDSFDDYYEICLKIIRRMPSTEDEISFCDFFEFCDSKLTENYADAIYQNARNRTDSRANVKSIVYSTILAAIQQNPESESSYNKESRSDLILLRVKKFFYQIVKMMYFVSKSCVVEDKDIVLNIFNQQDFEFLDDLFEGTVKQRSSSSASTAKSSVRPVSQLLSIIFEHYTGSFSFLSLCHTIRNQLILDPYHIDELPFDKISPTAYSSFRRTTLAHNSRRVVHLHNINKIELLRKDEFADIHLRICHDKPKASFVFAPLRIESAILDSLEHCQGVVLGVVHGLVVLRNCHNFRITVSCDTLICIDCSKLDVHIMSPKRPLVYNCQNLNFAPFNTTYENHLEFLINDDSSYKENKILKEPINIGNSSWQFMDPSKFVCQHTPLYTTDDNVDILLDSLPEIYRKYAHRNAREAKRRFDSENLRISDVLPDRDLIYLKSKIEKNHESDVDK